MKTVLKVPKLAVSMQDGVLSEWLVPNGSTVTEGQPIYGLEADKSVVEIEAPVTGVLTQLAEPGATYQVGAVLGEIEEQE